MPLANCLERERLLDHYRHVAPGYMLVPGLFRRRAVLIPSWERMAEISGPREAVSRDNGETRSKVLPGLHFPEIDMSP